jgi:hypothetical protein
VAVTLGMEVMEQLAAAKEVPADAPLRDHRPHICNADDYFRMASLPEGKASNYRNWPGVVTWEDGTCCGGVWHAAQQDSRASGRPVSSCPGGGCVKPRKQGAHGNDKSNRVDQYGSWVGTAMGVCPSYTCVLPTMDLLTPR